MRARIVVFAGHVHNYEHHEHGGVTYFVSGGGGAHAYPIERQPSDLFQSKEINYHYIEVNIEPGKMVAVMNRLELKNGVVSWSQPDRVTITAPAQVKAAAASRSRQFLRGFAITAIAKTPWSRSKITPTDHDAPNVRHSAPSPSGNWEWLLRGDHFPAPGKAFQSPEEQRGRSDLAVNLRRIGKDVAKRPDGAGIVIKLPYQGASESQLVPCSVRCRATSSLR